MAKKKAAMTERMQDEAELEAMASAPDPVEVPAEAPDVMLGEGHGNDEPDEPLAGTDRAGPPTKRKVKTRDPGIMNKEDCTPDEIEAALAESLSGIVTQAFNNANTHSFARCNPTFNEQRLAWQAQLPTVREQFERAYRRGRV